MSCSDTFDWHFTQGEDAVLQLTYKDSSGTPIDLTNYTVRSQGREEYQSDDTLFAVDTTGGGITLDAPNGVITINVGNGVTAAINAPISGVWDCEIVSNTGVVTNILGGKLVVTPEVTR